MRHATLAIVVVSVAAGTAGAADSSHGEYFEHYQGTATCLECHEDEAKDFFHTEHYQWRGQTPQVANSDGDMHGKLDMINDFCTNPQPNWIGEVTNDDGKVLAAGCSKCHAGFGLMPSDELSREQLENIDCLVCHASGYRRGVYQNDDGSWEWRPILWKNQEGLDSVSKRISRPTRTMCLRCHSASGGGPNYKRGDIEYTLAKDADPHFDVHMSPDGADLHCVDCHAGDNHRVVGRGADLVSTDSPEARLSCADGSCHEATPHRQELINRHADRIACNVCHTPTFAKDEPTDMFRDWSAGGWDEDKGKYAPHIEVAADVVPTYAWYDGTTRVQLPRTPVELDDEGRVMMAVPVGDRSDPGSKIHAFKVHRGRLPVLQAARWIGPITTEEYYRHGDIDLAVREAAEIYYGLHDVDYEWVETIRYMGIYHEVQPAEHALGCLDCHGPDGRLDWTALGYDADPLASLLAASH
jgi:hypothetical protein